MKETKIIIDLINELSGTKNLKDARESQLNKYRKNSYRRFKDQEMHEFISSLQVGVLFGLLSKLGLWDDYKREITTATIGDSE